MEFDDWRDRLAYMGAAASGHGSQYLFNRDMAKLEAQQFQYEQAEQQRQAYIQSTMQDIGSVYELVQAGDFNNAREVIQQGMTRAHQFGDTNSDWFEWADALDNGRVQEFRDALDSDVTKLVGGGKMAAPPSMARKQERKKTRQDLKDKAKFGAPADRIQMWEYMKGLPPEEREAFRTMSGQGVTVNTGLPKPPNGFMWNEARDGLIPIPGGPADIEANIQNRKDVGKQAMTQRAGTTVIQDLGRAGEMIPELVQGDGMAGANARSARALIKGSPEWKFVKNIESAKSNIGLDRLQEMRENSPTGGALGQVPFQQQKRLEQVYGEIDLGMDIPMIEANINRIQNIYTDIIYGSPEERALAVQEGRMTPEQSAEVDGMYRAVPFDQMGVANDAPGSAYERWKKENNL